MSTSRSTSFSPMRKIHLTLLLSIFFLAPSAQVFAQNDIPVETPSIATDQTFYFFFSPTCPHCHAEDKFLKKMEDKYPTLVIKRYPVAEKESVAVMRELAAKYGIEDKLGGVPLSFIGSHFFIGYRDDETTGRDIEDAIRATLGITEDFESRKSFDLPFLGRIYADDFSLPVLAILLGFLDGFNVCSLGALVLIIGLTLKLQERRAIILLGGMYIVTTALIYGGLMFAWAYVFDLFGSQVDYIKIFVTLLAFGGGVYFLKEYWRMHKQGALCELQESKFINRLMEKTGKAFEDNTRILGLLGVVVLFAAVMTIVEFPCSAATPLVFVGVLKSAGLGWLGTIAHIAIFITFYMLDELIIFAIAAYRLKLWMTSGKFTKYAVLVEAIVLITISIIYIIPVVDNFLLS